MARKAKYQRTTNRQSWSEDSMSAAIQEVLSDKMGYKKASTSFNVPQSTLEDRVRKARKNGLSAELASKKGLGRYKPIFSADQEKELVEHIIKMEESLFRLTLTDLRELAFEMAEKNGIQHTFNKERKTAGKEWLYSFLSRNPKLALRYPKKTSLAREEGFNRSEVQQFFTLLQSIYEKHHLPTSDIYNVNETCILIGPNKPSKVFSLKEQKQVGCPTKSSERGVLVTVEMCMNAAGNFMPPMFVFPIPRAKANPLLMKNAPPGSFPACNKSGCITKETFLRWFRKFVAFSHPSADKPVLLILDDHSSRAKSIEVINTARESNVILLCFPPHTSHRLQPIDVSLMAPLSTFYEQEVRKWLINNHGLSVTIQQIGHLFSAAYLKAAIPQNAINGFQKTGIYPFNSDVLPDHLFAPSDATEKSMEIEDNPLPDQPPVDLVEHPINDNPLPEKSQVESLITDNSLNKQFQVQVQVYSGTEISSQTDYLDYQQPSTSFTVSPSEIRSLPARKGTRNMKKPDKRRGKKAILTSSPYKSELELEEKETFKKKEKKTVRKKAPILTTKHLRKRNSIKTDSVSSD